METAGVRFDLGRWSDRPWGGRLLGLLGRDPARMFRAFFGQPFRKPYIPQGWGWLRRRRGEIDDATVFISAGSALDRRGSFRRTGGRLLGSLGRDPVRMFRAFFGWRGRRRGAIDHATAFAFSVSWRRRRKDLALRSNGARLADTTRISAGSTLDWRGASARRSRAAHAMAPTTTRAATLPRASLPPMAWHHRKLSPRDRLASAVSRPLDSPRRDCARSRRGRHRSRNACSCLSRYDWSVAL